MLTTKIIPTTPPITNTGVVMLDVRSETVPLTSDETFETVFPAIPATPVIVFPAIPAMLVGTLMRLFNTDELEVTIVPGRLNRPDRKDIICFMLLN
jgi:hypothetical protein